VNENKERSGNEWLRKKCKKVTSNKAIKKRKLVVAVQGLNLQSPPSNPNEDH